MIEEMVELVLEWLRYAFLVGWLVGVLFGVYLVLRDDRA